MVKSVTQGRHAYSHTIHCPYAGYGVSSASLDDRIPFVAFLGFFLRRVIPGVSHTRLWTVLRLHVGDMHSTARPLSPGNASMCIERATGARGSETAEEPRGEDS